MNYLSYLQSIFTGYTVTEESNYDYSGADTVIIVKYLGGGYNYLDSKIQPVQLEFRSSDISTTRTLAATFSKDYTNVSFWDDLEYISQYYSTPVVIAQFQGVGSNENANIIVNGTLIFSSNVSEIKKVQIDDYEYETTKRILSYTTLEDSQRTNLTYINTTNITGSILQFTVSMLNKNNDICLKARRIRTGILDKDTAFSIKLTYSDNETLETYSMKLHSFTLNSENSVLPMISMSFIK